MKRFLSCFLLLCLACCAKQQAANDQKQNEIITCKQACERQLQVCGNACKNSCAQVIARDSKRAAKDYEHYLQQRCVTKSEYTRLLASFRDPIKCKQATCDCVADFSVCRQSCAGKIQKRLLHCSGESGTC